MQWTTQMRESRRIGAGEASQSSGGELAHRSSAIYASGWLKNTGSSHDAVRCGAERCDVMRCGATEAFVFWPDARVSTALFRPIFCISSSYLPLRSPASRSFTRVTRVPISFIFIAAAVISYQIRAAYTNSKQCSFPRIVMNERRKSFSQLYINHNNERLAM